MVNVDLDTRLYNGLTSAFDGGRRSDGAWVAGIPSSHLRPTGLRHQQIQHPQRFPLLHRNHHFGHHHPLLHYPLLQVQDCCSHQSPHKL